MTREEAIKFAEYAQIMADGKPEVQGFYKLAEVALRAQQEQNDHFGDATKMVEPLTLDELREMDGEPVWVRSLDGDGKNIWAFVDTDCEMVRIFDTRFAVKCMVTLRHFKTYGKTWLAYRHKPEERTT